MMARRGSAGDRADRPVAGRTVVVAVAVIVVVVVVGGLVDTIVPASPVAPPVLDATGVPVADAMAASWFCTGATAGVGQAADTTFVLNNTAPSPAVGVMSTVESQGSGTGTPIAPTVRDVTVPGGGSLTVAPPGTGWQATTFSFSAGGVGVSQVVAGPDGWGTAPCASATSASWYFAGGGTSAGASLNLSLYNPGTAAAIVDAQFETTSGQVVPQAYQGVTVPAGQVVVENVGTFVQNAGVIGTIVSTETGTVVAAELDHWTAGGASGLSLRPGSPETSAVWQFAQSTGVAGGHVVFDVLNPSSSDVTVSLVVRLGLATVEPTSLNVPAGTIGSLDTATAPRFPVGTPYALTVTAAGGAGVVVGRTVTAPPGASAPQVGAASGTTALSEKWLVPGPGVPGAPGVADAHARSLAVYNPGTSPVAVTVTAPAPMGGPVVARAGGLRGATRVARGARKPGGGGAAADDGHRRWTRGGGIGRGAGGRARDRGVPGDGPAELNGAPGRPVLGPPVFEVRPRRWRRDRWSRVALRTWRL